MKKILRSKSYFIRTQKKTCKQNLAVNTKNKFNKLVIVSKYLHKADPAALACVDKFECWVIPVAAAKAAAAAAAAEEWWGVWCCGWWLLLWWWLNEANVSIFGIENNPFPVAAVRALNSGGAFNPANKTRMQKNQHKQKMYSMIIYTYKKHSSSNSTQTCWEILEIIIYYSRGPLPLPSIKV